MKIDKIIPYAFNNKNHSDDQIEKISQSLTEFGFRKPIEIDEKNVLIAWHARLLAAKKLWMKEAPVIVHSDLTEIQKKKYRILDNRLADLSTYNIENLKIELQELNDVNLLDMFDWIDLSDTQPTYDNQWQSNPDYDFDQNAIKEIKLHYSDEQYVALIQRMEEMLETYSITDFSDLVYKVFMDADIKIES